MTQPTNRTPLLAFALGVSLGVSVCMTINWTQERKLTRYLFEHGVVVMEQTRLEGE
jgi:hypothetical protein